MSGDGKGRGRAGKSEKVREPRSAPYPRPESERSEERSERLREPLTAPYPRPQGERSEERPGTSQQGSRGRAGGTSKEGSERSGKPGVEEGGGQGEERPSQSGGEGSDAGSARGGGGDGKTSSSQKRRGRSEIEVVETKPETCLTKKGVTGSPVMLMTNFFDIESIPQWVLYQYVVSFDVEETRERVKRAWLYQHKDTVIKTVYIFDGNHMYTSKRLTNTSPDILKLKSLTLDKKIVHVEIKFVQELHRGHSAYLQVFGVLLRRSLSGLDLHLVHRNYYDSMASVPLPQHYLEIWPGYVTSVRQYDGGIMMCTKVSHKVMRTDTALHVLRDCIDNPDYKRSFQQSMLGAVVLAEYSNKTYQVADVDFDRNPTSTFFIGDREVAFVDYYKQRYDIVIKDLRQPLLATRKINKTPKQASEKQKNTNEVLLIPELCRMTGLSAKMISNKSLMRDMAGVTRVSPTQRIQRLEAFSNRLHTNPDVLKDFRDWGLEVSRRLKNVKGRILPPETIQAGNGRTFQSGRDCDWTVPLRSSQMYSNGVLRSWVFITSYRLKDCVERFLPVLRKAADGMQIRIPPPVILTTRTENASELVDVIERALAMHNPDLLAFGFSNDRQDRYAAVKRKCCVDRGVASQVILQRSMASKGVMSIATKIAIQIHVKTGGVPWNVPIPSDKCMVVGFDVCHDTVSKSVGAMVASTSPNMTTWYSSVNQHSSREEISYYLANDIFKAIMKFHERNKVLPGRLIIYRDGVGDGQLRHVLQNEVEALKEKLNTLYEGNSWKMAYVIVTKRANARLFFKGQNPSPGTIVDDDITQPERYDFYLVSQSVRQGTVTPTQYNIISDNMGWSADIMQRFTYKMTHLYYNSSTPCQVPAPCQYAHKLAFLANQALRSSPHPSLDERLYFL